MDYVTLGRTGLRASVMGLGCGGPSRIGQSTEKSEDESVRLVRSALDLGVNFIDTAEAYRTEEIIGKALRDVKREDAILSTKKTLWREDPDLSPKAVTTALEDSLRRLGTDHVDIYHAHGVGPALYPRVRDEVVPTFLKLRDQGKIRFLGITEGFGSDPSHVMLRTALRDDCWEVVMVGFNILNQTARESVFPVTQAKGIGTLIMFAVRRALSRSERLREVVADLVERGKIDEGVLDPDAPLGFLAEDGEFPDVTDASYRFCRYEPGADVILSGTGDPAHLAENAASLDRPDLPPETRARLQTIFQRVDDVSGG